MLECGLCVPTPTQGVYSLISQSHLDIHVYLAIWNILNFPLWLPATYLGEVTDPELNRRLEAVGVWLVCPNG